MSPDVDPEPPADGTRITEDEARAVARENAALMYGDLSIYDVSATLSGDVWHVDYDLNDPGMVGGGPHYLISATTGEIVGFRLEQ